MISREAAVEAPQPGSYIPGIVLPPLLLGMFLRALQMTVIAPSLVNISQSLGSSLAEVGWIMAIYATGSLVAQPVAGRMSDAKGRRLVFIWALALFLTGSLACALSTTLVTLVLGRVVQSLGAGALQPAAIAIIGQQVPAQRQSTALYLTYGMFALAGALGAVIGGLLIDGGKALGLVYPWHLIFWINIPLGLLALILTLRLQPDRGHPQRIGFDVGAIITVPVIAVGLMLAANGVAPGAWVWTAVTLCALLALAWWEAAAKDAFFEASLFSERGPRLLYLIAAVTAIPIFSVTMYSAAYYIVQFGATAAQAGIALLALALPLGLGQALGGRYAKDRGPRFLLGAGILTLAIGESMLGLTHTHAMVLLGFAVVGFGVGVGSAPPSVLMLRYVSEQRSGAANGLLTMLSSTGAITAPAAVSALLRSSGLAAAQSFRLDFLISCAAAALCLPLTALLPRPSNIKGEDARA
jgi:MFS family permease